MNYEVMTRTEALTCYGLGAIMLAFGIMATLVWLFIRRVIEWWLDVHGYRYTGGASHSGHATQGGSSSSPAPTSGGALPFQQEERQM